MQSKKMEVIGREKSLAGNKKEPVSPFTSQANRPEDLF